MILIILFILFSSTNFTYCSQDSSKDEGLIQPFIPSTTLGLYQDTNLYGSINNDSMTTQGSFVQTQSIFQYPEDFDPQYYKQDEKQTRSKKEICYCVCSGISSSTILAFIGYLIFH